MGKNIYLYHGSDQDVVDPKCDHGFKGHDFGQCFYTTYSRATAKNWAAKRFEGKGVVNKFKRPDYDIIIGPIADFGLKKEFLRMKTEGLSFSEVASRIHYDKYRSLQVSFCTPYSLTVLNKL